ncbi:hypothetical protein SAMN04487969_11854 [Paenibacillus algorifonticola]|uniref:Beta-galactosidase n=1 Tax=Paenibacillus algorifonticola TaxID=684063 RepID=A0A1I2GWA5_9BACL|nr:hypothetical protein [Paenibacillus algorifonticola]SFF21077.1 hypothetical protein SAMN04487969_11854 [Paenibacillus algorifonticola]
MSDMQVALVEHNGKLMISADDRLYPPLAFRSFRPDEQNVTAFYEAGVRVMSLLVSGLNCSLGVPYSSFGETWIGENNYDFEALDRQLELFQTCAPEAKLFLMVHLDTREWWLAEHEGTPNSFSHLSQVAGYDKWREDTALYLENLIAYAEKKYPDLVLGYFLMGGRTTEWFSHSDYGESHPLKEKAYRKYTGNDTRSIPNAESRNETELGIFRHPVKQHEALDYWRFHHHLVADTVLYFAERAKQAMENRKLVGVFFGYLFELAFDRLLHEGHLAYEKLFNSQHIDIYCAPSSYAHRGFSGVGAYMNTIDSLLRRKKMFFLEFDHITHQSPKQIEGKNIPGYDSKFLSETQTLSVMRRDFCMAMAKRTGLWWFDMFGGWFDSPNMKKQIASMQDIANKLLPIPMASAAEIAVFADAESMYYADAGADINTDLLLRQMDGLGRIGAPYDLFSLSELHDPEFNRDKYKFVIFLNAFYLSPQSRKQIQVLAEKGTAILWMYCPGLITEGGFSADEVTKITGFEVELSDSAEQVIAVEHSHYSLKYGFSRSISPILHVSDPEASIWGTYEKSKMPALASKLIHGAPHFFSGMAPIPGELLQRMAVMAGVHLYCETNDPLYVNDRLIGIQAQKGGMYRFHFPKSEMTGAVELFDGAEITAMNGTTFEVEIKAGETKLFLLKD